MIDLIRGKEIKEAQMQLKFINRRASMPILKLINSALANAKVNFNVEKDNLYIKEIRVDEAPPHKRLLPVSRGRANPIIKRNSNVILTLETKKEVKIKKPQIVKSVEKEEMPKEVPSPAVMPEKKPEKPKYRAPREVKKGKGFIGDITKKIFRRKSF